MVIVGGKDNCIAHIGMKCYLKGHFYFQSLSFNAAVIKYFFGWIGFLGKSLFSTDKSSIPACIGKLFVFHDFRTTYFG